MYKSILVLFLIMGYGFSAIAQKKENLSTAKKNLDGQFHGKIFTNFHCALNANESDEGFEVKRAYLGYKMAFDEHFSGNIKLDIGSPDDVSEYSLKKRFAYFKNAYLQYKIEQLTLQFGIADCQQFKVQEKFWGYRYIYKSFQDENKFGPSADMGLFAAYKINSLIQVDAAFTNGEGYATTQSDNDFKTSAGITLFPIKHIILRMYADRFTASEYKQTTTAAFVDFKNTFIALGAEYNYQWHNKFNQNHNMYGYSAYSTISPWKKLALFARYDHLFSNKVNNDEIPWNLLNDGSSIVCGIEFSPIKSIQLSVNYQDWLAYAQNGNDVHALYFNLQYAF